MKVGFLDEDAVVVVRRFSGVSFGVDTFSSFFGLAAEVKVFFGVEPVEPETNKSHNWQINK